MKSKSSSRWEWLIPAGLLFLSFIPTIAGSIRLVLLSSGGEITAENARFFAAPLPVVIHIIGATLFSVLGAFQFAPGFRRNHRTWHRIIGRLLIPAGMAVALSGLWMAQFYPWPAGDGMLLYFERLGVGATMFVWLLLSVRALWMRRFTAHGQWMIRAYALGMGAGTQAFTHLFWEVLAGHPNEFTRAMLMAAGWLINVAVAEWIIRSRSNHQPRRAHTAFKEAHL